MILRFKPGSDAEKEVQTLIAKRDESKECAKNIIEEITRVRPLGFGYNWFFGLSYAWSCFNTGFEKSAPDEIDGMKFIREKDGVRYFSPNRRTKAGKEISNRFSLDQSKLQVDSQPMEKFGIYTCKDSKYTDWAVGEDDKGPWMAVSASTIEWLEQHQDVILELKPATQN